MELLEYNFFFQLLAFVAMVLDVKLDSLTNDNYVGIFFESFVDCFCNVFSYGHFFLFDFFLRYEE